MSKCYIHVNLVIICQLVHEISWKQESVTPTPMPTPKGSAPKTICHPPLWWGDITNGNHLNFGECGKMSFVLDMFSFMTRMCMHIIWSCIFVGSFWNQNWRISIKLKRDVKVTHMPCKDNMSHVMRKPTFAICEQQRRRSACASAQSDQLFCCSLPR